MYGLALRYVCVNSGPLEGSDGVGAQIHIGMHVMTSRIANYVCDSISLFVLFIFS